MFSFQRVWAVVIRHFMQLMYDRARIANVLYWSFLDIMIIGYMAVHQYIYSGNDPKAASILIASIILWQIVVRSNFDLSLSLLEEIWAHNIVNLFGSPLSLQEWMIAAVLFASAIFCVMFLFYALVGFIVFKFSLFSLGWQIIPVVCGLFVAGLGLGFAASGFLIYRGNRFTTFVFMIGWIFSPLSGAYYSVAVLPTFFQNIAYLFPYVYFFEATGQLVTTGQITMELISRGMALDLVYLVAGVVFFKFMFERSRIFGLARLVD